MRIISGTARGSKLRSPEGINTRPTTDRIKETLFNIINSNIIGSNVLDLYSGSGALGLECISRGCSHATMVDNSSESITSITENARHIKCLDKISIVHQDVLVFLKKTGAENKKYNIIFLDPPYKTQLVFDTLSLIREQNILADDGIIVIEHSIATELQNNEYFNVYKEKKYKITKLSFLNNIC